MFDWNREEIIKLIFFNSRFIGKYPNLVVGFRDEGYILNLHSEYPDAPRSPYYLTFRALLRSFPYIANEITKLFIPIVNKVSPDYIIDIPETITPVASLLAQATRIPMISIRSEALKGETKNHGLDEIVSGVFETGKKGMIVDDALSSFAFTKFKGIKILTDLGLKVVPIVAVIADRNEGGREKLAEAGLETEAIVLVKDVFEVGAMEGFLNENKCEEAINFAGKAKKYALSH